MKKYFSNLLWAMLFASSNRHVIAHLIKYKSWYIKVDWDPIRFMVLENELERVKSQRENDFEKEKRQVLTIRDLEVKYDELNSKYELEVVKLKDLIQAKDLVIERMTQELQKEKSNEQIKLE